MIGSPGSRPDALRAISLAHQVDWDGFRQAARTLALDGVPPEQTLWTVGEPDDLFAENVVDHTPDIAVAPTPGLMLPRSLVQFLQRAIQARESARFSLMYGLVLRAHRGERTLVEEVTDPAVHRVRTFVQAVDRDTHKMRAFLRFRAVQEAGETRYVAWFEPSHFIVEANAGFFVRRFATMAWSILTPYRSAHWNGADLSFGPGASPADVPDDDRLAEYWRAYFANIFNPARLKVRAMMSEMPKKYWRNLPEAAAIGDLIRTAQGRTEGMINRPTLSPPRSVAEISPAKVSAEPGGRLEAFAAEAARCTRCDLHGPATQTVFGEGPSDASLMMVGEQPGDQEDLAGRPFVGPAGQLLDRAMTEAGIDRRATYVTNAVKHFKFEPRGKRRIHAKPDTVEIARCKHWLDVERAEVRPRVVVLMGATAARAVLGRVVAITRERGRALPIDGAVALITVHPSYLLRLPDEQSRTREYGLFVADLRQAAALLAGQ